METQHWCGVILIKFFIDSKDSKYPYFKCLTASQVSYNDTISFIASEQGFTDIVSALIQAVADVNYQQYYGNNALMIGIKIILKEICFLS